MTATASKHEPEDTHPLYAEVIAAIKADPQGVIREMRLEQLMSFTLMLPELIWAGKRNRAHHYEQYETAKGVVDQRRAEVELAVKDEIDPNTNKPANRNKEKREVVIGERLIRDAVWVRNDALRRRMYAQAKQLEHEIEMLENYQKSMLEILAMMTALIEFKSRSGADLTSFSSGRTSSRATRRARTGAGHTNDTLTVAGA